MDKSVHHQGFTLIELMTVVTIISILAAIAIPNFYSATIRAKVARSSAELELLSWALEMYFIDQDEYPINMDLGQSFMSDLVPLTTPVAYLGELPTDTFLVPPNVDRSNYLQNQRRGNPSYFYVNFIQQTGERRRLQDFGRSGSANYILYGNGPKYPGWVDLNQPSSLIFYNPSNGTQSDGSIVSFGS